MLSLSSVLSSALHYLFQRNWDFASSSLVNQTSKFKLAGQSAGPLAQALSALQQTQQQQLQQQLQQQIPLSLSLHTGDVTSDTNVPSFGTTVPPPPPAMTTSQLQQLEHQLLQTRQQIGDHAAGKNAFLTFLIIVSYHNTVELVWHERIRVKLLIGSMTLSVSRAV